MFHSNDFSKAARVYKSKTLFTTHVSLGDRVSQYLKEPNEVAEMEQIYRLFESDRHWLNSKCGISDEAADDRNYGSFTTESEKIAFMFAAGCTADQIPNVPCLSAPQRRANGSVFNYHFVPMEPVFDKNGDRVQEIVPRRSNNAAAWRYLDIPLASRPQLETPDVPAIHTNTSLNADAVASQGELAINFAGASSTYSELCRALEAQGFADLALEHYVVIDPCVERDSDFFRTAMHLNQLLPKVKVVDLKLYGPETLAEFLAVGHSVQDLCRLATDWKNLVK